MKTKTPAPWQSAVKEVSPGRHRGEVRRPTGELAYVDEFDNPGLAQKFCDRMIAQRTRPRARKQLIKTRMLVTANSGGGKSYLLRVLLEQLGRTTPIIVLDREGDYVTLGEKLDVVQVGPARRDPRRRALRRRCCVAG
jgi:hypothetical protein